MNRQKKQLKFQSLIKFLEDNKNFVIIKYEKTPHLVLEKLRRELKKTQAKLKITKNSLLKKAIHRLSMTRKDLLEVKKKMFPIKENSAIIGLAKDYLPSLNSFFKFSQNEKTLFFKFGLLDDSLFAAEDLNHLAVLPSRNQLLANLIGSLKAPASRLVYGMKFNINKLVYILKNRK
ncbi:MAG: 50S ribosomal protein L10 [Microgenomates group bacterium]|nr:50S ribosomal protein L10 [Microgenomates group bacterium]